MEHAIKNAGPYIVSMGALLGVILTALYSIRRGRLDAQAGYAAEMLKFRLRQIEEFYAPAFLYVEQSKILYEKLLWTIRQSRPKRFLDNFRLLDHIYEFKQDTQYRPLVERIISIGNALTALISTRAALIEGGVTQTFIEYQAHFDILKAASELSLTKSQTDGWQEFGYYPRLLNREIHEGYKAVLQHLDDYANAGDRIIADLLRREVIDLRSNTEQLLANLRYYELNAESYADRFDGFDLSMFRHRFITKVRGAPRKTAIRILDVGCGTGRDLLAFIRSGFAVTGIDASPALLRICRRKLRASHDNGSDRKTQDAARASTCVEMTFDEVRFRDQFDGVWAAASLLHVPLGQIELTVMRLIESLKPGGVLFMSFNYGRGVQKRSGRTFNCYDRRTILSILRRFGCSTKAEFWLSDSRGVALSAWQERLAWAVEAFRFSARPTWLNVLAQKPRT